MSLFQWKSSRDSAQPFGPLEWAVMEVLWVHGESNVRDVSQKLTRPLAYTTVMTTLDRLFKKGMLQRRKEERAFFYSAAQSRMEWEQQRAGDMMAAILAGPRPAGEMLMSCLVEAVGAQDAALLDELERRIRLKRREIVRKEKP